MVITPVRNLIVEKYLTVQKTKINPSVIKQISRDKRRKNEKDFSD